mgnify:CR=1 FL=1
MARNQEEKWQESILGDVCFYVSEKIDTNLLSEHNYISTENMLPEKSGITFSAALPTTKTTSSFKKYDVLVSNIRPYFKKIWHAKFNGGCSNDILVFRAKENTNIKFLYYVLSDNRFFDYATKTSKGTKMPRGDKAAILKYPISIPPLDVQKKIAGVLGALDDKIELNNKINQNLEAQAQALFKSWFIDFEPFGGKMPNDWEEKQLFEVSQMYAGGDKPKVISEKKTEQCSIPIYSNGISDNGLYGWTNEACIFEESVTVSARGTIGFVCLRLEPFFPIVRLISLLPNTELLSAKYLYFALCNEKISGTGTTQQQLTIPYFRTTKILLPSKDIMNKFTRIADAFYALIEKNKQGNAHLSKLRDTLLPKLMNGEIDVDNVKID